MYTQLCTSVYMSMNIHNKDGHTQIEQKYLIIYKFNNNNNSKVFTRRARGHKFNLQHLQRSQTQAWIQLLVTPALER